MTEPLVILASDIPPPPSQPVPTTNPTVPDGPRATQQPNSNTPAVDTKNRSNVKAPAPQCQCHNPKKNGYSDKSGRNLVVCIDGTSNQYSDKVRPGCLWNRLSKHYILLQNTNVVELYSRLEKNEKQLTFYNSGIGTYATPSFKSWGYIKQVIGHKLDLAIAWYATFELAFETCNPDPPLNVVTPIGYRRFEKIVVSAYRWLADNYRHGDRIFLFGTCISSENHEKMKSYSSSYTNVRFLSWCISSTRYLGNDRKGMFQKILLLIILNSLSRLG